VGFYQSPGQEEINQGW
jgi:hypothetical protein